MTQPTPSVRPGGRRRLVQTALALLVAAAAVAVALLVVRATSPPAAPAASTAPSAWSLPRLQGSGSVALGDFRGRPLVVDFFASWCGSCRSELPEFLTVSETVAGRVGFVGVDSEENGDGLAMARQYGITVWPLVRDVGGSQQSGLRDALEAIPGMPITAFYDAAGHLRLVRLGALSGAALSAELEQLFGVSG